MRKTLSRHGNSLALIIDKPILELLRIDPDTELSISTDGRSLIVTPVGDRVAAEELQRALESVNRRHGAALKRLAE